MSLSSSIPWWGAILIAAISASSGLAAVQFQSSRQDKAKKLDLRHTAYLRFLTASELLTFRSTVMGSQRSVPNAIYRTFSDLQKMIVVTLLAALFDRFGRHKPGSLRVITDSIPTPTAAREPIDQAAM